MRARRRTDKVQIAVQALLVAGVLVLMGVAAAQAMTFEDFQSLSIGYTEEQVIAYVGPPMYKSISNCQVPKGFNQAVVLCCQEVWVYQLEDGRIATLTFGACRPEAAHNVHRTPGRRGD